MLNIRYRMLIPSYWQMVNTDAVRPNILRFPTEFFAINPNLINSLGGTKSSQLTEADINANLRQYLSSDFVLPANSFLTTNWSAKGWTPSNFESFIFELNDWINLNFERQILNVNFHDVNIVLTQGVIGGMNLTIPLIYFGNQGLLTQVDGGNFVGDTQTLDVDGGLNTFTVSDFDDLVDAGDF